MHGETRRGIAEVWRSVRAGAGGMTAQSCWFLSEGARVSLAGQCGVCFGGGETDARVNGAR